MSGSPIPVDTALAFSVRWPVVADLPWGESAFVGAYHPSRALRIERRDAAGTPSLRCIEGDHWFLWGTESPVHPAGVGLVHPAGEGAVAFRGYLTDPPIHSYSSSASVAEHWMGEPAPPYNGVFAAVVIDDAARRVTLTTDALGLGPLYYRTHEGALLFASNPRLLAFADDEPDLLAWRSMLECGSIPSDRSLSRGVLRVPAGATVVADADGVRARNWFDFDQLPRGERPLDDAGVREVENRFHDAVSRCLRLENGGLLVPLSSGYDSRRTFADIHRRGVAFDAITARSYQKGARDLDAPIAAQIAADHKVPHRIVETVPVGEYAAHDSMRQQLVDCESPAHVWVIQFSAALPREPTLVFDGVLGDVLGNPGFRMDGLYQSRQRDLELILDVMYPGEFGRVLDREFWPSPTDLREEMTRYIQPWMDRGNMAEFAFLLLRQRRLTSPWSQQLLPGGHVAVNPYADLDYLSLMFEFIPAEKHALPLQRECLRRFWPELHRYPGNRRIPPNAPPVGRAYHNRTTLAADRDMRRRLGNSGMSWVARRCSRRGRAFIRLSQWSDMAARRCGWFIQPLMAMALRELRERAVWTVE